MPKQYVIRHGFSFVQSDGSVKAGGEVIELDDDVAAMHLHKLDEVPVYVPVQLDSLVPEAPVPDVPTAAPADAPAVVAADGAADAPV